nr:SJCHGC02819 protein [Schistosoma japonicum]
MAINPDTGEPFKPISLPKGMQCRRIFLIHVILLFLAAGVPGYQPTQLIQSLIHALSSSSSNNNSSPIIGQEQQPSAIEKNPCVIINHLQPMIKTFIVTDDDIRRQEARVKELRKKLETARKKLHPRYETEREG